MHNKSGLASYTKVVEYFDSHSLAKVVNFWTYSLGDIVKSMPRRFVILRVSWGLCCIH